MILTHPSERLIIGACKSANLLRNECSYIIATARHETGNFRYMREIWGPTAAQKRYEGREDLGNSQRGDGKKYMGRGFVQITGRRNYQDWSRRLGVNLIKQPQLAEKPEIAVRILVEGMKLGTFTGKKLSDYITLKKSDFVNARRIVNGTDKAALIAGFAKEYDAALKAEGYGEAKEPTPTAEMSMKLGDTGPWVEELQRNLNTLGMGPLDVDGQFLAVTEKAVRAFQAGHKDEEGKPLKIDGIVGLRTSKAIAAALLEPKIKEAEKNVPPAATKAVEEKAGWLKKIGAWISAGGLTAATLAERAFGADWKTVLALGGLVLVGGAIVGAGYLVSRWLKGDFKQINDAAAKEAAT